MLEGTSTNNTAALKGTKAETLKSLSVMGFNVPKVYYFNVKQWAESNEAVISAIMKEYIGDGLLAVRSSSQAEDSEERSMAGAFESLLNVKSDDAEELKKAVETVIHSFDDNELNQVLVQPMVVNVAMSGVVMTKVLDDGSPYYVVNFDDSTGLTDTVTSGTSINKTVYIYNGFDEKDFDSPYLLKLLKLVIQLEKTFPGIPLDIEFAIDKSEVAHLLQVRRITTINNWKNGINDLVSDRISHLADYVEKLMKPRINIFGNKTLLGIMPDWNPAEMIGVVPHPLALSLYRELITKSTWRIARERMGYRKLPNVDLMVSLFGRVFIDVRNSINSFLPNNLSPTIAEKVVNAYIKRLEQFPQLHDKIEFEVVHTAYDFDFENNFKARYSNVLSSEELKIYKETLRNLTLNAIKLSPENSLEIAYADIEKLKNSELTSNMDLILNSFDISDKVNDLLGECVELGTIPFSIIARHGFIAESMLRSAVNNKVISIERIQQFKKSVKTISGKMSEDFYNVCSGTLSREAFIADYGHLRPSSYDILSPTYANRSDLFSGIPHEAHEPETFVLSEEEVSGINQLLKNHGFEEIDAQALFIYAEKAIVGREYAKFVFTKHLAIILELIAKWGELEGFTREDMAMLSLNEILSILFAPLTNDVKSFYRRRIDKAKVSYDVALSFKLSYLIRSKRDIYVVPQQRSTPNFIGSNRIEAEIILLTPHLTEIPNLTDKIVCIEGADPGYDWIFSRNIAGLVTKYGGANSHMAIRCAEYNLPAAIGCGEQPFERLVSAKKCLLDCQGKRLEPLTMFHR